MSKGVIAFSTPEARDEANTNPRLKELLAMLTYARPSGSASEAKFINRFIIPLGMKQDSYGNLWKDIPDAAGVVAPILWSCHTDTVHRHSGKQRVVFDGTLVGVTGGSCLGADDTVGCWLMRNMIEGGISGRYVFHRDEEIGGLGSAHVRDKQPELLQGMKFAIAFDRKGYTEVITHQGGARCASDAFGNSMIQALKPMSYQLSSGGTFTDTANYKRIVPECCNLGVGYFDAHTTKEQLDCTFAQVLLCQLMSADWTQLVCARDPKVYEYAKYSYGGSDGYSYGGHADWDSEDWTDYRSRRPHSTYKNHTSNLPVPSKSPYYKLVEFIKRYPYDVATFLLALGYDAEQIEETLWEAGKALRDQTATAGKTDDKKVIDLTAKAPTAFAKCDDCGCAFYTVLDGATCPECGGHSVTAADKPADQNLTVQSPGDAETQFAKEITAEKLRLENELLAQLNTGKITRKEYSDAIAALDDLQTTVGEMASAK